MSSRLEIGCVDVAVRDDGLVMFKPKTQGSLLTHSEAKLLANYLLLALNPVVKMEKSSVKEKKKGK